MIVWSSTNGDGWSSSMLMVTCNWKMRSFVLAIALWFFLEDIWALSSSLFQLSASLYFSSFSEQDASLPNTFIMKFSWNPTRGGSSRGAAGLQPSLKNVRQNIPPNDQTRLKSGFSCEISQHNHFRYFNTILAQRLLGILQNQCFALFQRRRWCDDVFSTLADEFGDFGAVFGTDLKERNQTIGYKKHDGISAYRKAFLLFWR